MSSAQIPVKYRRRGGRSPGYVSSSAPTVLLIPRDRALFVAFGVPRQLEKSTASPAPIESPRERIAFSIEL